MYEFIRIKDIPIVFLGFAGGTFTAGNGDRTTVSELMGLETKEIYSRGKKIEVNPSSLFAPFLKKNAPEFEYYVTYEQHPGVTIGKAKSKSASVGFYTRDFIFLPGFAEDSYPEEDDFLAYIYKLNCTVRREEEALKLPEWTSDYLFPREHSEREKLDNLSKQIQQLQKEREETEIRLSNFLPLKQLWSASGDALNRP